MEHTSLKNLWHAVARFRREQPEERRRESRLPAHGLVRIYWEVEGKTRREDRVSLLGISEHGCSFRTGEALVQDQKIFVDGANEALAPFEAVVRHVEPDGREYIVGAEIISRDGKPLEQTERNQLAAAELEAQAGEPEADQDAADHEAESSTPAMNTSD